MNKENQHGQPISSFDIDDEENSRSDPLSDQRNFKNPLPSITGGMKPSKLKKYSYILLIAVPVIFYVMVSGLTMYQMSLMGSASISKFEDIRGVIDNTYETACALDPITDIKAIKATNTSTCPGGWEMAKLGSWPGTRSGCYSYKTKEIREGGCNGEDHTFEVKAWLPRNFTIWKGYQFCLKRLSSYERKDSDDCAKGKIMCWANPGYYCVPETQKCPISKLEKTTHIPTPEEANTTYITLELEGEKVVYKYQNEAENPGTLADLTTSYSTEPCLDPLLSPQRVSANGYPYTSIRSNGCGKYGIDADSRKIDTYREATFNLENGLELNLIMPETAVPDYERDTMVLIAKYEKVEIRHLGCNMCSPDFGWRLETGGEEIHILDKYYRRYSKIGRFLVFAMICVLIFNVVIYLKNKDNLERVNDKTWTANLVMLGFLLGHYVTAGIFAFLSYLELNRAAYATDLMVQWNCFQNRNINTAMKDFHNDFIRTNLKVTVDGMVVIVVSIIAVVLFMVADYVLHDIKAKENIKLNREEAEHRVHITGN